MDRLLYILPLAYLAGSINFAIVLLRLAGKPDPRKQFSGNPGAFNVSRQYGKGWAGAVLFLDMGRAAGVGFLALHFLDLVLVPLAGMALILGNRFPVFHGFKGGKGVGNYLGFTLPIAPLFVLASMAAWVLFYKLFKEAFIGSFAMITVLALGGLCKCGDDLPSMIGIALTFALIVLGHKENIMNKWGKSGSSTG